MFGVRLIYEVVAVPSGVVPETIVTANPGVVERYILYPSVLPTASSQERLRLVELTSVYLRLVTTTPKTD